MPKVAFLVEIEIETDATGAALRELAWECFNDEMHQGTLADSAAYRPDLVESLPPVELVYSSGGHGGPWKDHAAARIRAEDLVEGNASESWIALVPASEVANLRGAHPPMMNPNTFQVCSVLLTLLFAIIKAIADLRGLGASPALLGALEDVLTTVLNLHNAQVLPSFVGLTADEVNLLNQDKKIQAIKSARARLGLGLKEAKDLVEAHPAHQAYRERSLRSEAHRVPAPNGHVPGGGLYGCPPGCDCNG